MSKSLGNTVSPLEMKERIGMDAFRYFVLRESVFGQDADFREDALTARYNADLANNLGNLVSRALAMQNKYFSGIIQPLHGDWAKEDHALKYKFAQAETELHRHMAELQFHRALESVWAAIDHANRYIVQTAPFTLFKDPLQQARVGEVLHHLIEAIRQISRLLGPFMPDTAKELQRLLGIQEGDGVDRTPWGQYFSPGHRIDAPAVLFPRIQLPNEA
jgi:methionyl-tRNA synthetase